MATCYLCGAHGADYRREVYTGSSQGMNWGRRVSVSSRSYYGVRTVCAACAARIDARRKNANAFFLIVVVVIIIFIAIIVFSNNSSGSHSTSTSSNSGISTKTNSGRVISVKGLNVRKDPNQNSDVLTTIPYNETVSIRSVVEGQNKWYEVEYNGVKGFVLSKFVEIGD